MDNIATLEPTRETQASIPPVTTFTEANQILTQLNGAGDGERFMNSTKTDMIAAANYHKQHGVPGDLVVEAAAVGDFTSAELYKNAKATGASADIARFIADRKDATILALLQHAKRTKMTDEEIHILLNIPPKEGGDNWRSHSLTRNQN